MAFPDNNKFTFSGHESFPCKTLWLKKEARNSRTSIRTQTYILSEKDKKRVSELETEINKALSGNSDIEICTLLEMLNKKMKG